MDEGYSEDDQNVTSVIKYRVCVLSSEISMTLCCSATITQE